MAVQIPVPNQFPGEEQTPARNAGRSVMRDPELDGPFQVLKLQRPLRFCALCNAQVPCSGKSWESQDMASIGLGSKKRQHHAMAR